MTSKTITLKLEEKLYTKLSDITSTLRLQSPNLAAKQILTTALSGAFNTIGESGSDRQVITYDLLYSIQADIQHLCLQTETLITSIERLAVYTGALTELLLINIAETSAEDASETVRKLLDISFGESK